MSVSPEHCTCCPAPSFCQVQNCPDDFFLLVLVLCCIQGGHKPCFVPSRGGILGISHFCVLLKVPTYVTMMILFFLGMQLSPSRYCFGYLPPPRPHKHLPPCVLVGIPKRQRSFLDGRRGPTTASRLLAAPHVWSSLNWI